MQDLFVLIVFAPRPIASGAGLEADKPEQHSGGKCWRSWMLHRLYGLHSVAAIQLDAKIALSETTMSEAVNGSAAAVRPSESSGLSRQAFVDAFTASRFPQSLCLAQVLRFWPAFL